MAPRLSVSLLLNDNIIVINQSRIASVDQVFLQLFLIIVFIFIRGKYDLLD